MTELPIKRNQIKKIYQERFSRPTSLSPNDPQLFYLLAALPEDRSVRILDAGCGDGRYSEYLVESGYSNIHAVDLLDQCPVDGVSYQTASVDALPFEDNFFDFVFSNSVVFYVDPPEAALVEFHRVLKANGMLMITAHTRWSLFTLMRVFRRDFLDHPKMAHLIGVKFYSASYYQNALMSAGFKVLLRDGWKISSFLYPVYRLVATAISKVTGIRIPVKTAYITKNRFLGKIKSEISYHSVFVAKKLTAKPIK